MSILLLTKYINLENALWILNSRILILSSYVNHIEHMHEFSFTIRVCDFRDWEFKFLVIQNLKRLYAIKCFRYD